MPWADLKAQWWNTRRILGGVPIRPPVRRPIERGTETILRCWMVSLQRIRSTKFAQTMAAIAGYALFFLMLVVPTAYRSVKVVLIVIILAAIARIVGGGTSRVRVHPIVVAWTIFYVLLGIAFVFVGVLQRAPGALSTSTVYVLWPVLYLVFISAASQERFLEGIQLVLAAALLVNVVYALAFIGVSSGALPSFLFPNLDENARINFVNGVQFWLNDVASLLFLIPYGLSIVVLRSFKRWGDMEGIGRRWILVSFSLILSIPIVFLSLRRGLILVVILTPLLIAGLAGFLPANVRKRTLTRLAIAVGAALGIALVVGIGAHLTRGWSPEASVSRMVAGFDFAGGNDPGASDRHRQFNGLIQAWLQHPILGAGHGAVANVPRPPDVIAGIRSGNTVPWSYELWYLGLLFQTGLVGFALYTSGVVWIFWTGARIVHAGHPLGLELLPVLIGSLAFLIANATNPYLAKYDYLWIIFLPVAYINLWLLESPQRAASRSPLRWSLSFRPTSSSV